MEFLNRNFSRDWQHLQASDGIPDLSGVEQGNQRSCVLTPETLSDRSSSDLISQRYNHPTNRIVRYPTTRGPRSPKNFTTAVRCQQPLSRVTPKSFLRATRHSSRFSVYFHRSDRSVPIHFSRKKNAR